MKFTKFCKAGVIVGIALLIWFSLFEWNVISYPADSGYTPKNCYSPNHHYYIIRYQTVYMSVTDQLYANGLAILYDGKTGKELYRGKTHLSEEAGPHWSSDSVYFEGVEYDWHVKIPTSPGSHPANPYYNKGCFDEISDYIAPRPTLPPQRVFIVKGVEPRVKLKAPYQLQFLVEDQHGTPFTSLYYLVIREDGSYQRGETDEQGRSFVIESTHNEAVKIFISPFQTADYFMMPEELKEWCTQSPDNCMRAEDHTFTANTINIKQ